MTAHTDEERVRDALARVSKVSGVFRIAFLVFFVIYILCCIYIAASSLAAQSESTSFVMPDVPQLLMMLLSLAIGAIVLLVLARLFGDISRGQSPFTMQTSKRLLALGIILLVDVVLESFVSTSPALLGTVGDIDAVYTLPSGTIGLYVDAKLLVGAIVCFCLAYVFRYGALLQWLTDETA